MNQVVNILRQKYPYTVEVADWSKKIKDGTAPRAMVMSQNGGSWMRLNGARVFGFTSPMLLDAFKRQWGLQ